MYAFSTDMYYWFSSASRLHIVRKLVLPLQFSYAVLGRIHSALLMAAARAGATASGTCLLDVDSL